MSTSEGSTEKSIKRGVLAKESPSKQRGRSSAFKQSCCSSRVMSRYCSSFSPDCQARMTADEHKPLVTSGKEQIYSYGKCLYSKRKLVESSGDMAFVKNGPKLKKKVGFDLEYDGDIALQRAANGSQGLAGISNDTDQLSAMRDQGFNRTVTKVARSSRCAVNPDSALHGSMVKKDNAKLNAEEECEELQAEVDKLRAEHFALATKLRKLSEQCLELNRENTCMLTELSQM